MRSHWRKTENARKSKACSREREMNKQFEREFLGGDVVGRGQAESPGSDGASPYLRRDFLRQLS